MTESAREPANAAGLKITSLINATSQLTYRVQSLQTHSFIASCYKKDIKLLTFISDNYGNTIIASYCAVTGGDGLQRAIITKSKNNICNKKYKQHMAH